MSEISYKQEVQLLESMLEGLAGSHHNYESVFSTLNESIDSVMPIYYTDIASEWVEAGMPQSDNDQGTILEQMTYSLWECYNSFAYNIIREATDGDTARELVQEALGVRQGYAGLAEAIIR